MIKFGLIGQSLLEDEVGQWTFGFFFSGGNVMFSYVYSKSCGDLGDGLREVGLRYTKRTN